MSRMKFFKEIVKLHGVTWIAAMGIVLLVSVAISVFHDVRWLVVTFMLVCIVIPVLMVFVYFYYGLKPATVTNILPHKLRFEKDNLIEIVYSADSGFENREPEYTELSRHCYSYSEFGHIQTGVTSLILPLKDVRKGFLWLPTGAFEDMETFSRALNLMVDSIRKCNHDYNNQKIT